MLPSTRREAIEQGLSYYFTGRPCKHGHMSKRRAHNDTCYECEQLTKKKINKASYTFFSRKKHNKTMNRLLDPRQMPAWADKEKIGQMIIDAKKAGLVLDHIVPLKGKARGGRRVCGLHVEYNLTPITYEENDLKGFNKWPDMWEPYKEPREKRKSTRAGKRKPKIRWDKRRNRYYAYIVKDAKHEYVGSTKTHFDAWCLIKSTELKLQ